jgi:hypothetical protein
LTLSPSAVELLIDKKRGVSIFYMTAMWRI